MNIKPLGDGLIVKQQPKKERTDSGIFLPENSRAGNTFLHDVIAVGPGVKDVKVGDVVYVAPDARRATIDYAGDRVFRIFESEVPCIIEP
jgi:co-chaperonin GroES (HSP10)